MCFCGRESMFVLSALKRLPWLGLFFPPLSPESNQRCTLSIHFWPYPCAVISLCLLCPCIVLVFRSPPHAHAKHSIFFYLVFHFTSARDSQKVCRKKNHCWKPKFVHLFFVFFLYSNLHTNLWCLYCNVHICAYIFVKYTLSPKFFKGIIIRQN